MNINQHNLKEIQGLLIFKISDKEYCSDIKNISTTLKLNDTVFEQKNRSSGEIVSHETYFKMLDINKILKIPVRKASLESRIILFDTFGKRFGFIVDKMIEIITTDSIFLEKTLDIFPRSDEEFISGELVINDRKIFFLNFGKFSKELYRLNELSEGNIHPERLKTFI